MTRRIDLDQRRAEANAEPIEVVVAGRSFTLPAILPVALTLKVDQLARDGTTGELDATTAEAVFRALVTGLAGDQAEELMELISLDELQHLMVAAYGMTVGESSASAPSSPNGGTLPRLTVPASTKAT